MFSLTISGKAAVQLEPNIIYRVGRGHGLDFQIDEESMEPAHAVIVRSTDESVIIAALLGNVLINGKAITQQSITKADLAKGVLRLAFGNVSAELSLGQDAPHEEPDSSGYGEGGREIKSANTTADSFCVPETEPPSANTTADSLYIPETQAICLAAPPKLQKPANVSMDDFFIPETQVMAADLVEQPQPPSELCDSNEDLSEFGGGTQIRIMTQDFNQMDEAVGEDSNTSIIHGDAMWTAAKPSEEQASELEMSSLNWSTNNSKFTALNSTKADRPGAACVTPDNLILNVPAAASHANESDEGHQNGSCTPDLFDLLVSEDPRSCTPDLFDMPAARGSLSSQIARDSFRAPDAPSSLLPSPSSSQDFVATQVFCPRKQQQSVIADIHPQQLTPSDDEGSIRMLPGHIQDFIPTQPFRPMAPPSRSEDFLETQVFVKPKKRPEIYEDMISTQVFVKKRQDNANAATLDVGDQIDEVLKQMIARSPIPGSSDDEEELPLSYTSPCVIKDANHTEKVQKFMMAFLSKQQRLWAFMSENKNRTTKLRGSEESDSDAPTDSEDNLKNTTRARIERENKRLSIPNESKVQVEPVPAIKPKPKMGRPTNQSRRDTPITTEAMPNKRRGRSSKTLTEEAPQTTLSPNKSDKENSVENVRRLSNTAKNNVDFFQMQNGSASKDVATKKGELCVRIKRVNSPVVSDNEKPLKSTRTRKTEEVASTSKDRQDATSIKAIEKPPNKSSTKKTKLSEVQAADSTATTSRESRKRAAATSDNQSATVKNRSETPLSAPPKEKKSRKAATATAKKDNIEAKIAESVAATAQPDQRKPRARKISSYAETSTAAKAQASDALPSTSQSRGKRAAHTNDEENATPARTRSRISQPAPKEKPSESAKREATSSSKVLGSKEKPSEASKKEAASISKVLGSKEKPSESAKKEAASSSKVLGPKEEPSKASKREAASSSKVLGSKEKPIEASKREAASSSKVLGPKEKQSEAAKKETTSSSKVLGRSAICDYVESIRASGRKIKISLSLCDRVALDVVIKDIRHIVELTEDPLLCDALIMDKSERTYKFLVAVASNKPILCSRWLLAIRKTQLVTVEKQHLFSDAKFEHEHKFKPSAIMDKRRILKGHNFLLGEGILPKGSEMKAIIQCSGGFVYSKASEISSKRHAYVVTTKQDKQAKHLSEHPNLTLIRTEGVMQALVQQNVELLNDHKLRFI